MQVKSLEIVKSSGPSNYEYLTVEILLNSEPIISIDREKGFDALEAEVYGVYRGHGSGTKVSLDDLIDALIQVRKTFEKWNAEQ
jgi:hypothetical protein